MWDSWSQSVLEGRSRANGPLLSCPLGRAPRKGEPNGRGDVRLAKMTPKATVIFSGNLRNLTLHLLRQGQLYLPQTPTKLPANAATAVRPMLSGTFDSLCPLASRPSKPSCSCPWLFDILCADRPKPQSAEIKLPADLDDYQHLLSVSLSCLIC
ncbi:hypothetical protein SKAU_G00022480 [Synaphobranchus kaupii]|uniref:Uncharacterized protein n=1 Tax=Synaphobranchus kaupii TaxID=118154 RepID=A0A9Q1GC53_SYNKA|nr:hypothetical protein SKAU_G00022480 [Synaphobranchus kaupii]